MPLLIDKAAREVALTQWALPDNLHVPIAAVDEAAITTYIGEIEEVFPVITDDEGIIVWNALDRSAAFRS
jgi:hypothetical protein